MPFISLSFPRTSGCPDCVGWSGDCPTGQAGAGYVPTMRGTNDLTIRVAKNARLARPTQRHCVGSATPESTPRLCSCSIHMPSVHSYSSIRVPCGARL
jgi:hypothetical protein